MTRRLARIMVAVVGVVTAGAGAPARADGQTPSAGGGRLSLTLQDAVQQGLNYPPTEAVCRVCHNENSPFAGMDYVFDFKERVSRGTHHNYPLQYKHDKRK